MEDHLGRDAPAVELADALGLHRGISGYVYHTVPLALYCWLRQPGSFRQAVEEVVTLGGDADSTGAVVGGIAGATVGAGGIPAEWVNGLLEWPRSVSWMRMLAERLAGQFPAGGAPARQGPLPVFWPGLIPGTCSSFRWSLRMPSGGCCRRIDDAYRSSPMVSKTQLPELGSASRGLVCDSAVPQEISRNVTTGLAKRRPQTLCQTSSR